MKKKLILNKLQQQIVHLPYGQRVWYYDRSDQRIYTGVLRGFELDSHCETIENYRVGIRGNQCVSSIWEYYVFFSYKEVLNFVSEHCKLPLVDTKEE